MFHRFSIAVLLAAPLFAQPLEYTGKPLRVPYTCTAEEIQLAGISCVGADPCPVYLELSNIDTVGLKLFVTGNIHTDSATFRSLLLSSKDGGRTWSEPFERLAGAGLDQVQFIDFENGWISGSLLQSPPRDPFFLLSNDGGLSWRRRPIFSEPRPGAIDQFWFDTRASGTLLIDRLSPDENGARYALYETMTGGDTWTLRQLSATPIAMRRARFGPNPDWRVRADGPTRSFHIEARRDSAWRTIAAFAVNLGECHAPEPTQAEPPPTPGEKSN